MEEIRKRINEVVYDKHLSNRAFSAMVGMKPTSVNNYLNGTKTCTLELIAKTIDVFVEISAEWLLRGEGAMIKGEVNNDDAVRKELADVKAKLLVQEGITRELRDILLEKSKIDAKRNTGLEKYSVLPFVFLKFPLKFIECSSNIFIQRACVSCRLTQSRMAKYFHYYIDWHTF